MSTTVKPTPDYPESINESNENNLDDNVTKSFQKKHLTTYQANTLRVVHKCVAEYDNLIRKCNAVRHLMPTLPLKLLLLVQ